MASRRAEYEGYHQDMRRAKKHYEADIVLGTEV